MAGKIQVEPFLAKLKHSRKPDIEALRTIIRGADKKLKEHIKWNAPSYGYDGDDRLTFRLQPGDRVELIFHRGAKVKDTKGFKFADPSGLCKWITPDRGVVVFESSESITPNKAKLKKLIVAWMKATSNSRS